jgi:hypothetical protein
MDGNMVMLAASACWVLAQKKVCGSLMTILALRLNVFALLLPACLDNFATLPMSESQPSLYINVRPRAPSHPPWRAKL